MARASPAQSSTRPTLNPGLSEALLTGSIALLPPRLIRLRNAAVKRSCWPMVENVRGSSRLDAPRLLHYGPNPRPHPSHPVPTGGDRRERVGGFDHDETASPGRPRPACPGVGTGPVPPRAAC